MKTQLFFEHFRCVSDSVELNDGDIELGFEDAKRVDLAMDDLKERLHAAGLSPGQIKKVAIEASFAEFDSSNWTHACAVFHVTLKVPQDSLAAVRVEFACELEAQED